MKKLKRAVALMLALMMIMTAALAEEQLEVLTETAPETETVAQETEAEAPSEAPEAEVTEQPSEAPTQEPAEEPGDEIVEGPAEEPGDEIVEGPAEEPGDEIVEGPAEEPGDETVEAPAEEPLPEEQASDKQAMAREVWDDTANYAVVNDFVIRHDGKAEGTVVQYIGNGGNVTVPEGWDGGKVTEIATGLAKNSGDPANKITGIAIPGSGIKIGANAFCNCDALISVKIAGDNVSIDAVAFADCDSLSRVEISGANVTLGNGAFQDDKALKGVRITGKNATVGVNAFLECAALQTVELAEGITEIGNTAFASCIGLKSFTIPSSVTAIGQGAFEESKIQSGMRIPGTVKSIGDHAFLQTAMPSLVIEEGVATIGTLAFNQAKIDKISLPASLTEIKQDAFKLFKGKLIVPEGSYAEQYCKDNKISYKLADGSDPGADIDPGTWDEANYAVNDFFVIRHNGTAEGTVVEYFGAGGEVTILESWKGGKVTAIDDDLIWSQTSNDAVNKITKLTIPASVTKIGENAFYQAAALTSVAILGDNVEIGKNAFNSCEALKSVSITGKNASIGASSFMNCTGLETVDLGGAAAIGSGAFSNSKIKSNLRIPGTVARIGSEAFANSTIPSVVVEEGVTAIEASAFAKARIEGTITLPASVTEIGGSAFQGCSAKLMVPAGSYAEQYCKDNNINYEVGTAPAPVVPTKVTVTPDKVTLAVGETQQLTAVVEPAEADQKVSYKSDNNAVATVSESGLIMTVATGSATITVETSNGLTATCAVTVEKPVPPLVIPEALTLGKNETYTLSPKLSDGGTATFEYTSSNTKNVKVTKKGKLTALKDKGTATITVKASTGVSNTCVVTLAKAPTKVTLNPTKATLGVGESVEFSATLSKGSASKLTPSSSKTSIAAVTQSEPGKFTITAKKAGSATITVKTFNNKSAKFTVTVKKAPTDGKLTIAPAAQTLAVGLSATLKASYAKNFAGKYSWSSSDESKATVTSAGVVTAIAAGDVTISATTYNGVVAKCALKIEPEPDRIELAGELTLGKGEKFSLAPAAMAGETKVTAATFTYSSDKTTVAKVGKAGKITAVNTGKATITVKSYNGKSATCVVNVVKAPSKVTLSPTKKTLKVGESTEFTATLPKGTASQLTVSTTKASVATITQTEPGKFTIVAKKAGKATITVKTFNGKTAKFTLTVK